MATSNKNLSKYDKATIPNAKDFRFGIVVSEWNPTITEGLFNGAFKSLKDCGAINDNIVRWNVPGSFELIYGCKRMQQNYDMLDAIIAIGSVIQGETKHFDFVCEAVSQGIKDLNIQNDILQFKKLNKNYNAKYEISINIKDLNEEQTLFAES